MGSGPESEVRNRLRAGGEWIRTFSSAMPRHTPAAWPTSFGGDWRRLEPLQEALSGYRGRRCSDDTAASRVARPQLRASLETTVYLARTCKFQRRVGNELFCHRKPSAAR